jgi:uncharacterized protein
MVWPSGIARERYKRHDNWRIGEDSPADRAPSVAHRSDAQEAMHMDRELGAEEIRVLACLVEKEATTPDNYPLSSNALVNACNQSTNRDPVVSYTERTVDQVVLALREAGLARTVRGDGQRVHKHKHVLLEAWKVSRAELALLSVLMLRGAQTVNELRVRTERYETGLDADGIERVLRGLADRQEPLTRLVERRPGEREARWIHLLGGAELADAQAASHGCVPDDTARSSGRADELAALRTELDALTRRFDALLERLGETID